MSNTSTMAHSLPILIYDVCMVMLYILGKQLVLSTTTNETILIKVR